MYISKGRCNRCMQNKKVLKFNSPEETKGLCKKCLRKMSEHPNFK